MRITLSVLTLTLIAAICGCGEGYQLVPARIAVVDVTNESSRSVVDGLHVFLLGEGFEDLGKFDVMIALFQSNTNISEKVRREELDRLNGEQTYLNDKHKLRVVLSDFSTGVPSSMTLPYVPPSAHFVEIAIFDERPGGFGVYGNNFYSRILAALSQNFGSSVRVIASPPPTDEATYRRVTVANTLAMIFWWCMVFAVTIAITGSLSRYFLKKLRISRHAKRLVFALLNAWLVTPLPFPAGFILVILMPNLFAFPWTSKDYYHQVASFAPVSFSVSLVLCIAISGFLFKDAPKPGSPSQELT